MALGQLRVTGRGYRTVYTVPAGKRAIVNAISSANASTNLALIATTLGATAANATVATNTTTSVVSDNGGQFAYSIATDGNFAAVGYGTNSINKVQIFYFNNTTWTLLQTIEDPAGGANGARTSNFGFSLAMSENTLIIGSPGYVNPSEAVPGRAYRYTRVFTSNIPSWSLAAVYEEPTGYSGANFGRAVAVAGDYVVIGAASSQSAVDGRGIAYGYNVSKGSVLQVTFTNPVAGSSNFGSSVACWRDGRVLIGNRTYNSNTGRAYYYSAFSNSATIIESPNGMGGVEGDQFGSTLACDKTGKYFTIAAGAFFNFPGGGDPRGSGRVYVYSTSDLTAPVQTIVNPVNQGRSYFGYGLDMDYDGNILIGSYLYDGTSADQGRAYYYARSMNSWILTRTFENPSIAASDYFGFAVGMTNIDTVSTNGNTYKLQVCVIGEYGDDNTSLSNNGRVHFISPLSITEGKALADLLINSTDHCTLNTGQTFERTGLVLDAGESLIAAIETADGDVTVQVRGYEETV